MQCKFDNRVTVSGKVEISSSPALSALREAEKSKAATRDKVNLGIQIVTVIVVTLYTGLTYKLLSVAQDTYNVANRPYIGLDYVQIKHGQKDASGAAVYTDDPTPQSVNLFMTAVVKNFGTVPGTNANINWRIFLGDTEQQKAHNSYSPGTLFPSQTVPIPGRIGTIDYPKIMDGELVLQIEVYAQYDGPGKKHTSYCQRLQFSPQANGFYPISNQCDQ